MLHKIVPVYSFSCGVFGAWMVSGLYLVEAREFFELKRKTPTTVDKVKIYSVLPMTVAGGFLMGSTLGAVAWPFMAFALIR